MLVKTVLFSTASLAICCGWFQLAHFSATPGEQAAAPVLLPADLFPAARLPLLLVFVHPQCSCTPATYAELDQLLNQVASPVDLVLAVYESSATRDRTRIDPGILLHHPHRQFADANGLLAQRFQAATSGEVLLYSTSRRLLFEGGITPSRAHAGDSPGARALLAALGANKPGQDAATKPTSVFGCPIFHLGHSG